MLLQTIDYAEFRNEPKSWQIEKLSLGAINLIVGSNSSGKTRVVNVINALSRVLSGKMTSRYDSGRWKVEFQRQKGQMAETQAYEVEFKNKIIVHESFKINKSPVMERSADGKGFVKRKARDEKVRYQVQQDQLMAVVRRDQIQHPQFDQLHKWAKSVCLYRFGTDLGKLNLTVNSAFSGEATNQLEMSDQVENANQVFRVTHERFGPEYKNSIIADMEALGYPCDDISLIQVPTFIVNGAFALAIAVREKGMTCDTGQNEMSQGMYRALALSIQLNANIFWTQSYMVGRQVKLGDAPLMIVDDIGEGLDFDRSRKLISLLVRKATENNIQLVMTSNDRFVMNDVPLEYWTVLHRIGGKVRAFNYHNSKTLFDEFQFLGLNNFDFFSGKYFLDENHA